MEKTVKKVTPLMKQYNAIKTKHPDAILLFRVGDFYETFGEDAIKTSKILDIILTKRGAGSQSEIELAGFPHHSLNNYLPKLVKAGNRVAICDQLENPKLTKTIVKRGVTELVTPGLATIDGVLNPKANNFLASVYLGNNIGVSFLDISTGEFIISEGSIDYIDKLLQNFNPSEILISKQKKLNFLSKFNNNFRLFFLEDWVYQYDFAIESLCSHFKTKSLKGFGVEKLKDGLVSAGAIMHYLSETQHQKINHITSINRIPKDDYVWMDGFTIKNLEIFQSFSRDGKSLIDVIDKTISPMGGRLLKRWVALPSKNIKLIRKRHMIVKYLIDNETSLNSIQENIKEIGDLERLISKVATGKINPREIVQLKNSLAAIEPIKKLIKRTKEKSLKELSNSLDNCNQLRKLIEKTLNEEAPVSILKGNSISSEFSKELKNLRGIAFSSKDFLNKMLQEQSEITGIPSLKISSNNVFGYYIEVRNTHKDKVPEQWIRKQTLVNAERYITDDLKKYESKILGAEERILKLEIEIFQGLINKMYKYIKTVQNNALIISQLDCFSSFAQTAKENSYCMPEIDESYDINIVKGRHAVIEAQLAAENPYVANDLFLDREKQQIIMITGPNMSGKSALLRQTALIVVMAQIGSFVPAENLKMGIIDKIFTRVGASDNISMGESTFMVEMNEAATILNNISDRSLILLDEIGRGTSTYDGISIAWAISEFIHDHSTKAKTLFATHYHELNEMTLSYDRIKNFNVSIKEEKNDVLFLRKLIPGGSEHSFGIHVAKMAGMPRKVLNKANSILRKLEKSHSNEQLNKDIKSIKSDIQLEFFKLDDPALEEIKEELLDIDINSMTPMEALLKLSEIKRKINDSKD
ncbi:MAG: DNA mismatch repair protein MutS [Flavobacteriaceae bacterium]|nr:DNA mismatch repair protein MutS [Flavobacteriaceae bacterium]MBT4113075.1 DNA mismatch repair protein MutS [Flavobacteriaceae bacterium]MBT4613934.1 DNA mismatch repair protein MutS [Flavobacteriaceae bacterium]MBT5246104.1 DNA mismatch repair protein MutS [Flavobacteriaceae bacterium]MBT5650629.1 DNA mismatch repair protein MutS [Flavobacteriaceae bacterium]